MCECLPGWAGPACSVSTASCPGGAGAPATAPGIRAVYYNDTDSGSVVATRVDASADVLDDVVASLSLAGSLSVRWSGLLRSAQTGWHFLIASTGTENTMELFVNHRRASLLAPSLYVPVYLQADRPVHFALNLRRVSAGKNPHPFSIIGPNTYAVGAQLAGFPGRQQPRTFHAALRDTGACAGRGSRVRAR